MISRDEAAALEQTAEMGNRVSTRRDANALERLWAYGDVAATALILVGAFAAVFIGLPGAVLMLAGVGSSLAIHLVVGVIGYRRVMAREWPQVPPVEDADDW